jgi:hypothetical protein
MESPKPKMSKETYPVYEAQVGALGRVTFFKDSETKTYCFMFFNGSDYTPLSISEGAAYFVWAFIGCEHPDIAPNFSTFTPPKKAGRGKPKKQPSKPIKKKAKSK